MLSAYVLIESEVGIARLQAPSLDQLGRLVVSHIQLLDGVTRTVTCIGDPASGWQAVGVDHMTGWRGAASAVGRNAATLR